MVRPPSANPASGNSPRRRGRATPGPGAKRRSNVGRIAGALIATAAATGVGTGLNIVGHHPSPPPVTAAGPACGGTERWNVKVANDPDSGAISLNPKAATVAEMNALLPGPVDGGGRMEVEKTEFTVRGFLSFFRHEDDGDYHAVITDETGGFSQGKTTPPNGHSIVVEFPDIDCLSGKSGKGPTTSPFSATMGEARAVFEAQAAHLNGAKIPPKSVPVTVTGVAFFDFDHGQTGRGVPHPGVDGQMKVIELHPVTAITFENAPPD